MISLVIGLLDLYKFLVSPWLGMRCRYSPSCTDYAKESLKRHGLVKGFWLAAKRVARCHPLGGEGFDPVPK